MRLLVKQSDGNTRELQFEQGPISIGRGANNRVFLPDKGVSREHAVIRAMGGGKWMIEDLGSSNKTFLNNKAVRKAEIKHGDFLRITDFTIEVILEKSPDQQSLQAEDTLLHLEAALTTPQHETVVRKPDAQHAPAMRLAARRLSDFSKATETIFSADELDQLLLTLLDVNLEQFNAYHVWCALRKQPTGPMTCHGGKRRDGSSVQLSELQLSDKITQAVEKGQFFVLPSVSAQVEKKDRIRSAMVAAIMRPTGCFGVLYVDNAMIHEHYSLSDLDYLMLIAMHTAAILKKFLD
ncbi:MAG: FHA domain-containing protein [Sedimentisphaerales bacterium]|nr:FHA domain-containing protein [Sedimentisphaerales bacterium]